jgi:hypothetical protein
MQLCLDVDLSGVTTESSVVLSFPLICFPLITEPWIAWLCLGLGTSRSSCRISNQFVKEQSRTGAACRKATSLLLSGGSEY